MKKEDHQRITRSAINAYLDRCSGVLFKSVLEKYGIKIVRATETEDVWYSNWDRPFHWHFYKHKDNPNPDHFHYLGSKMTVYSHHVFNQHVDEFSKNLTALASYDRTISPDNHSFTLALKAMFESVGGMLHHIQDMSTPSHVVPVFHGTPAPGEFKAVGDQFETFSADNIEKYLEKCFSQEDLDAAVAAGSGDDSFNKIYETAAEDTLRFLRTAKFTATIGTIRNTDVPCSLFWQEYDYARDPLRGKETAGFGQYGPLEKFFGKKNLQKTDDSRIIDAGDGCIIDGQQWNIKFDDYSHIYFESLRQMVCNSVRCLRLVDVLYSEKMGTPLENSGEMTAKTMS